MRTIRKYSLEIVYVLLALLAVYILPAILRLSGANDILDGNYYTQILPIFALVSVGWYTFQRRGRYIFAVVAITGILLGQGLFLYEFWFYTLDAWSSLYASLEDCILYGAYIALIEGSICAALAGIVAIINAFRKQKRDCKRSQL